MNFSCCKCSCCFKPKHTIPAVNLLEPKNGIYDLLWGPVIISKEMNDSILKEIRSRVDFLNNIMKGEIVALETLKDVKKLGGFDVVVMDNLREQYPERFHESGAMDYTWFEKDIRPKNFVYVRHDKNSLSFTLQNGPVKEFGVNGCQVDTIICAAMAILEGLNKQFPSRYNARAITSLEQALEALESRKKDRIERGVEGFSKA